MSPAAQRMRWFRQRSLFAATLLAGGWLSCSALAAADKPNIVLITADDLGYGDLGCYGHPVIRTPRLDRLAAEGLRFTQFYSGAEVCTPSRAAILTGRLPPRTGMASNKRRVLFPDHRSTGLPAEEITLAEALRDAGYATCCVGKWHLGSAPPYLPRQHGFDRYFGIPYSNDMSPAHSPAGKSLRWPPTPLLRDEEQVEDEPDQRTLTQRYTAEAIAFIRQSHAADAQRPFFLYLPHTMPHVPIFASDRFAGHSPRGLYGDVVEELDNSVGEIVDALAELGLTERTLVIFTSDNGPWLTQGERGGSAGPLREGKGSTWEGGYRVPGIFWQPGKIRTGQTTTALGSALDVFPTCLAAAGAAPPADVSLDGFDLGGVLFGKAPVANANDTASGPRQELYYYRNEDLFAVRRGRWKLHFKTQAGYGQARPETHDPPLLYDLDRDPGEREDLAGQHPQVVAELTELAERHERDLPRRPPQY